eukprot:COSAG01_NODE_4651_length_4848_cov_27.984839_1_plen_405_part_10
MHGGGAAPRLATDGLPPTPLPRRLVSLTTQPAFRTQSARCSHGGCTPRAHCSIRGPLRGGELERAWRRGVCRGRGQPVSTAATYLAATEARTISAPSSVSACPPYAGMASDDKPPCRQHLLTTDTAQPEQPAEEYVFPTWWLYVQASFMAAPAISNSLILPLLIPPRVKQLVGEQRKAAALGAITSFQTMIQLTAPVLGALSDKLQTPCGRRRPFIIVGQLSILAGIWCIWHSTSYILLNAAYQLYFVGCLLAWVPWMSILPDIVAEVQRGQAAAIQSLVIGATGVLGYTMGVLRGESILSLALCYIICFVLHALMIPIGWMSVAARPGYCALEKQRAEPPAATTAVAAASTVANPGVCAALRDFVSPFWESPSFFWLFLNIMFFGIGNIFVSQWIFYWYTDIIG